MFIYRIVNSVNNKEYIGQTTQKPPIRRWYDHRTKLRNGTHKNSKLQNAWMKHGESTFSFEILYECQSLKELNQSEHSEIVNRTPWYNIRSGGENGGSLALETRQRLRVANLGKKYGNETKMKHKERMTGKPRDESTKEKIRKSLLGKKRPPETVEKMSRAMVGKKHTDETKQRISERMKAVRAIPCVLLDPTGTLVHIPNLMEFERQTGISASCLRRVVKGERKSHKGWTLPNNENKQ